MTVFHWVRHGDYEMIGRGVGGRGDYVLSETGRGQADRVAVALAGRAIGAVVTSPVRRAWETAAPIAAALGMEAAREPDLAEVDFAGWTGRDFGSLACDADWQRWNAFRGMAAVPDGETMHAVQARALTAMRRWRGPPAVVFVTHGDVIKAALLHIMGAPLELLRRIDVEPGSRSVIELWNDDAIVRAVNLPA